MGTLADPAAPSAVELAAAIAAGERSPVEVVAAALERAHAVQPTLNCFTAIWDDALADAERAAAAVARGDELGPLHGVPIAIKDTTPISGRRTTLGSYAFEHWVPDRDAYVVTALRRAGAIVVGQTTSPEFAHTLLTDSPLWGVTRNPHDPERTPGGSSGGSGAAVASGCVPLAEGSDMGGSVRIPAAWSGVIGLKPSFGRIPMDVLPGLFDSLSHHGPLARRADDARLFLAATQGPDDHDILSIPGPLDLSRPLAGDVRGMRFGLSIDLGCFSIDPEVATAVTAAAERLAAAGAVVEEVELEAGLAHEQAWVTLWSVFMATYYGAAREQLGDRIDPDVAALIDHGRTVSAVEYKQVELVRTDLWRRLAAVLADHDALLCPTMAVAPWPAAKAAAQAHREARRQEGLSPALTTLFNLVPQCPVISVPVGTHDRPEDQGLPIGMQVVGRRWRDDVVLEVARAVELSGA